MNRTLYKFIGALAAFVLAIATYSSTKASASLSNTSNAPAGYTNLIFEDNFDTFNSVWHHGHWWTREGSLSATNTNEQQAYAPANVTTSNGLLNITARKETVTVGTKTYYYTSGLVETGGDQYGYPDKFTFTYGYMEARIKIPSGQGLWPAFWLWPANYQDPPETDIMEIIGSKPQENNMTVHYTGGNTGYVYTGPDFSQDFHVYGCEWTPDYIAWFVDGVEVARFSDATRVSQQPMYLILNLAVGGDWPGPVSDSVLPATMQVDWVRVYQKGTAATSTPTIAPTNTPTPIPPTATPQATAQSLLPITYDDQNSAFVYSSGWQNVSTKNAYGGSYKQTSAQNSSVTLTFTGRSFSVLYTASSVYSRVDVYVDGVFIGSINEKASKPRYRQYWNYPGQFSAGTHTLQLIFNGPLKTRGSFDAVIVNQ